jgi:hypothetical protein
MLKLDAAGHVAYKRLPSLQMRVTLSICAQPPNLGSASVSDAGFGVAPKRTFLETSLAVSERNAQRKSAMARTPSPARVTRALPGTAPFSRDLDRFLDSNCNGDFRFARTNGKCAYTDSICPSGTTGCLEPGRYRWLYERIRPLGVDCLYFRRHNQTRLANRARSLQEKIFQSREDGDAHVFRP